MSHFLQLFAEKLTKTPKHGSLLEKLLVLAKSMIFRAFSRNDSLFAEKSSIWPRPATFRGNNHVSAFGQLFSRKLQKVAHFSKKNEKSSSWPKLATFRGNNHVSAFWSTFQEKIAKSGSFRENTRKIIDFAKTCNFSRKVPCLGVLVNFLAKSCKRWLISSKSTKSHRFT